MNIKAVLIAGLVIFLFTACSSSIEVANHPYDEIFKDTNKFVPINTKELKEIK